MSIGIGIIGCGLIGEKRAKALKQSANLIMCFDTNSKKSQLFSEKFGCKNATSISQLIENAKISTILVATRHDSLAQISEQIIKNGKHVFIEKPGALNIYEFDKILNLKEIHKQTKIHVGYNHRYHRGIRKSLEIYNSGEIGELMFLRSRYGHGGRLGYEKEWRGNKELSGGGELIDQGTHLLDLSNAFLGNLALEYGATPNYYWNMQVEDNAFISVKNAFGNIAFLHASCTEWKNMFSLEVYGKLGKIEMTGLGGSYGPEKVTLHKMLPEMGPPETKSWEYNGEDNSWELEIQEFILDIQNNSKFSDNLATSRNILEIVSEIYEITDR